MGGRAPGIGAEAARKGAVTPLVDAPRELGLDGDLSLGGRWVKLRGERCRVFVVASARGGFFTWCDGPEERAVLFRRDAREAIETGLRRSAADHRPTPLIGSSGSAATADPKEPTMAPDSTWVAQRGRRREQEV